jgi:hypothetical protein
MRRTSRKDGSNATNTPILALRVLLFVMTITHSVNAQKRPALLPMPQSVEWLEGRTSASMVAIEGDGNLTAAESILKKLGIGINPASSVKVILKRVETIPEATVNQNEAYRLKVKQGKITIESTSATGEYWALQTLDQLIVLNKGKMTVPNCTITDWPAFGIRGFMHDTGRGFLELDELKNQIELLSKFKINVFHWHLTEDLAWRLESRLFPMINDSANMVRLPGKYYTLEQARELMHFCKQHNMLLIPEIDMPGHSAAFRRALRHDMQSPEGMKLLKLLIDEVCDTFDELPFLHIGTDEVAFTNPTFVPEMVDYIRKKGKKVISWNPGWNYKAGEIDMTQMWSYRGKPTPGVPAIDSRLHYINHYDAFADLVGLFYSNIAGEKQGNDQIAGSIIALWNDRNVATTHELLIQNNFYPSLLTLAERTWRGGGEKYFYEKGVMMDPEGSEGFRQFEDFENRMIEIKTKYFDNQPFAYVKQSNVRWRITDAFPNDGDLTRAFPPEKELKNSYSMDGKEYKTSKANGAAIYLRHVWGSTVPSFYDNPQPNHTAYAYTWVYSPKKQNVGLWVNFQNYSRSEKDLPPPQGKWDNRESRIWLNDNEILPPQWINRHTVHTNEIPLANENFEVRLPMGVTLEKGWNKVLVKLPVGQFSTREVRLVKWMFTTVFVTPDGKSAVEGLIYSPDKELK